MKDYIIKGYIITFGNIEGTVIEVKHHPTYSHFKSTVNVWSLFLITAQLAPVSE